MSKIRVVAETGSDIAPLLAKQHNITLVPMHVSFQDETLDDQTFPVAKVVSYFDQTGQLPKTSGCTPGDFMNVFETIHEEDPDAQILYLAYSAVTTCSFHSAEIASEGLDYITHIDTKQVSGGQGIIVLKAAQYIEAHPEATITEVVSYVNELMIKVHMAFVPNDLKYLRAGGRVTNAVYFAGRLLGIHPCIEIQNGYLNATKKYRGPMILVVRKLVKDFLTSYQINKEELWMLQGEGLTEEVRKIAEDTAKEMGYHNITWFHTGCVITTHGGPKAFGITGFTE